MTDFEFDVMKRLKLKGKNYLIKRRDKDDNLILVDNDSDIQNYISTMRSLSRTSIKIFLASIVDESK